MPNGQLPDSEQVRLKLVSCKPATHNSLTYYINHASQASLSMGSGPRSKADFCPQTKVRIQSAVRKSFSPTWSHAEFLPYTFATLGLPASGRRSLLVVCSQDTVPAELRTVFLSLPQLLQRLPLWKLLAKHSSDTVKYEMEMMRRGSKKGSLKMQT